MSWPTISEEIQHCEKTRFHWFIPHDINLLASTIMPISFSLNKILVFKIRGEAWSLLATGTQLDPNPMKIILKWILLTGYPMWVHKKNAVVRYMFFNPQDVAYFRPVELFTKTGKWGKIKQSLGSHGLMKCFFNDYINQSDTVCLPLYKRMIPKWFEETWTVNPDMY